MNVIAVPSVLDRYTRWS